MAQTNFDIIAGRRGVCSQCGFKALVYSKPIPEPTSFDPQEPQDITALTYKPQKVCPTCFDTPLGVQSLNQKHQRPPNE